MIARLLCFFFALILFSCKEQPANIDINRLRCEYLQNPLGIDVTEPRLSWELLSDERAKSQSAYQVLVAGDSGMLTEDKADIWDSKKVKSNQTNQVKYRGKALESGHQYYWKVRVWDEKGNTSAWSEIASWSAGLLNKQDWKAKWIGAAPQQVPMEDRFYFHYGYQSRSDSSATNPRSVTVDLGKAESFSAIRLHPVVLYQQSSPFIFPVRFKIMASATADFSSPVILSDETGNDYVSKGVSPYYKEFNKTNARYIKVYVTKSSAIDSALFGFSLAEIEILDDQGKNIALKKHVLANNLFNNYRRLKGDNWLPELLTDGFLKPNFNHKQFSLSVPPSPVLRKEFTTKRKVKKAFLYASALGVYDIRINGKKSGQHILAPEWTDYHTRVQYQTYDVTNLLNQGQNVIVAMLADGWYAGEIFSHSDRGSYGFDRRLMAQIAVEYDDETRDLVATDESWKLWENGPVQQASIFNGEHFDARLVEADLNKAGFDDSKWKHVTVDNEVSLVLSAQMNEPIAVTEEITPVKIIAAGKGVYIFDIGQNIAGWVQLKLPYNPGKTIKMRFGEVLDEEGKLYTDNLRQAKQTDIYIPGNEKQISYEPRFTYHGFRYVEISGLTQEPQPGNVMARVVASSASIAGNFETSNPDLNKLWLNILWTQRDNLHSTPTDCPQRDERAGWMGDAQVFSTTAILNMDMAAFFTKWIRDIRDCQTSQGRFPDFAPQVGVMANFYNSPGWSDAGVIIPWKVYEHYGDTTVLSLHYDAMKKYIHSIVSENPDLLWKRSRGNIYGDWLNGNTIIADDYPKEGGKIPDDVYATAFFAYSANLVSKAARLLNKKNDIAYYDSLAKNSKAAFVRNYVSDDGMVTGNTQAGYALALDFDLVPENLKQKTAAHMVESVKAYDYRISTGIQTTIRLINQLTAFGYNDIAYRLIESHRFPSWLYSVDQGATTIWERWDGYVKGRGFQDVGMNSFNHYAIGSVGEWMYRSILGINNDKDNAGYKHFIIQPVPGGSLTHAKGSYHSIAGRIGVSWKKEKENFSMDVEIPVNTTATVVIPAGNGVTENGSDIKSAAGVKLLSATGKETKVLLQSGKYSFSAAM